MLQTVGIRLSRRLCGLFDTKSLLKDDKFLVPLAIAKSYKNIQFFHTQIVALKKLSRPIAITAIVKTLVDRLSCKESDAVRMCNEVDGLNTGASTTVNQRIDYLIQHEIFVESIIDNPYLLTMNQGKLPKNSSFVRNAQSVSNSTS